MRSFWVKIIFLSAVFSIVTLFVIDRFDIGYERLANCQVHNNVETKLAHGYSCYTLGFPFSFYEGDPSDSYREYGTYFEKYIFFNFLIFFVLYGIGFFIFFKVFGPSIFSKVFVFVSRKSGYQIASPSQAFSDAAKTPEFGDFFSKKLIWTLSIIGIPGFGYTLFVLLTERVYGWFSWRISYPLVITLFLLEIVLLMAIVGRAIRRFAFRNEVSDTPLSSAQRTKSGFGTILTFGYFIFVVYAIFGYYVRMGGCHDLGCGYELLLLFVLLPWSLLFVLPNISFGPLMMPLAVIFALFNGVIIYHIVRWIEILVKSFIRRSPNE